MLNPAPAAEPVVAPEPATAEPAPVEATSAPVTASSSELPPAETEIAAEEESSPFDGMSLNLFADAFYLVDWNRPDSTTAPADVGHRAFDFASGFGLAFAGVDFRYSGDNFGATVDLRFGEGASRLLGNDDPVFSILKQAFVSYTPVEGVSFDFGQFDTIYGAEVADSWANLNYTRGALYYLMQPFYHTGLRGSFEVSEQFGLTAMLVNGTNNPIDSNLSPHVGLQASYAPMGGLGIVLGYYAGPGSSGFGDASDPTSNDDWEHFFDLVLTAESGPVSFVGNVDAYVSGPDSGVNEGRSAYWGGSLAVGVKLMDELRLAVRGELLQDPDGYIGDGYEWLGTGTFTIDVRPVPNVILRLDNRFEYADTEIFADSGGPASSKTWFSTTLGVVVSTNP